MRTVMMLALCCFCAVARTSGSHILFMFADDRAWLVAWVTQLVRCTSLRPLLRPSVLPLLPLQLAGTMSASTAAPRYQRLESMAWPARVSFSTPVSTSALRAALLCVVSAH